ncbi:aquaporin [Streptomyces sp. 4N509B]|uniref:aquaporin n=1 Tax=Streptomyces sp. 4N509B TaxID=3457413 RepID=UPI003FD5498C
MATTEPGGTPEGPRAGTSRTTGRGGGSPGRRLTDLEALQADPQPLAAEGLGTFALVFFAVGTAVLAAEYVGSFGIALAFGFTLLGLAHAIGPVSGCHLNPAVTLGMLLTGRVTTAIAVRYWLAQLVGAVAGAALLYLLAKQVPGLRTSEAFGSNGYDDRSAVDLSLGGALLAEIVLSTLLVFVVLCVSLPGTGEPRSAPTVLVGLGGLAYGLTLAAVHLVGNPLTGTGVNPARSIGPALFAGGDALAQLWLFVLAPLVGAALAVIAHRLVHAHPTPAPAGEGGMGGKGVV